MKSYIVYFEGEIEVEAEDEKDAELQASLQLEGDFTITGVELAEEESDVE